jgi:trimeric autotransporter adhesin
MKHFLKGLGETQQQSPTKHPQRIGGLRNLGLLVFLALGGLAIAAPAQAQSLCVPSAANGYGSYAASGINRNSTWWLNWECYDDSVASTAAGQAFSFTLPDGSVMTTTVQRTGAQGVVATATPSWGGAAIGNGQYNGTTGKPILYSVNAATSALSWQISLSNIVVTDKLGNPRNFSVWVADGESTDSAPGKYNERLTLNSNGTDWKLIEIIPQTASGTAPATNTSLALNSSQATWTAPRATQVGSFILSTNSPTTVSVASTLQNLDGITYGGKQGMFLGLGMPKIKLTKTINSRLATADQFTTEIAYTSPTVSLATATSTGTTTTFDTGAVAVLPGNIISLNEKMTASSPSNLNAYRSSISCTNANSTTTLLPSGSGSDFSITPQIGDDISCTLTNEVARSSISGKVFEDPNYGGGSGRNSLTAGTQPRSGAIVELYNKANGDFIATTTTNSSGIYTFSNQTAGDYLVRVVNRTVSSSRTGGCPPPVDISTCTQLPVQTFRTDASTGLVVEDPNRVGGEKPSVPDTGAAAAGAVLDTTNFTFSNGGAVVGGQAESIAPVKVTNKNITGIDFGYNFDTIVNTNDSGQGSLRQFILNSNALSNTGLDQAGQAAGQEVSIFMIPNGAAHAGLASGLTNQLSSYGAAVITLATALPNITDSNTVIDGATQTNNIGNTNPGTLGTGGTVGTDNVPLPLFQRPEVEINGISIPSGAGVVQTRLIATGAGSQLKNTAANLHLFYTGNGALIQDNLVGMQANGTIVTALDNTAHAVEAGAGSNITVKHNFVRANDSGIRTNGSGAGLLFEFNEVDAPPTAQTDTFEGILLIGGGDGYTVRNNLIKNMRGAGTELSFGGALTNTLLENNSYIHNGYLSPNGNSPSPENVGIVVHTAGASQITISKNIVTSTAGPGIVVMGSRGVTITRNSIYGNGVAGVSGLGIDLDPNDRDPNSYVTPNGVTANNGTVLASLPNNDIDYPILTFAVLNNGTLGVKGYVGNNPAGSSTFAGVKVEFFIADNSPANQDGEVILGDGKTRPHSEGKTYIGSCTADANGLFGIAAPCSFSNAGALGLTNATKITATATDTNGNTSEFSPEPITNNPNLILVKRITAINGSTTTVGGDNLGGYKNTTSPYDDNDITIPNAPILITDPQRDTDKWPTPSTFLLGGTNGGTIKPNSEMDYTIYFLSAGDTEARNVVLCDLIPANQTFVPTAFNNVPQINSGLPGIDRGILVSTNNTAFSYTNIADGDGGRYYAPGEPLPNACKKVSTDPIPANPYGAIVVNLGNIPNASTSGSPLNSHGFIRFRVKAQ